MKTTKSKPASRQRLECSGLPALSPPITRREMLAVISDWSRCLRESHMIVTRKGRPGLPRLSQLPPEIQRELAVLAALSTLVSKLK